MQYTLLITCLLIHDVSSNLFIFVWLVAFYLLTFSAWCAEADEATRTSAQRHSSSGKTSSPWLRNAHRWQVSRPPPPPFPLLPRHRRRLRPLSFLISSSSFSPVLSLYLYHHLSGFASFFFCNVFVSLSWCCSTPSNSYHVPSPSLLKLVYIIQRYRKSLALFKRLNLLPLPSSSSVHRRHLPSCLSTYLPHYFKSLVFILQGLCTQFSITYVISNIINLFKVAFRVLQVGVYADLSWIRLLLRLLFWPGGLLQAYNRRRSVMAITCR